MKAILKFDLNDPDDKEEHTMCINASQMYYFICNLRNISKKWQRQAENLSEKEFDIQEKIFEDIFKNMYESLPNITT